MNRARAAAAPRRARRTRPKPAKTRVLLVDDQPASRRLLRAAVAHHPALTVAGESAGRAGARRARELRPDVAIVNVALPPARVADAVSAVARAQPDAVVLVVSLPDEASFRKAARAGGAAECLVRETGAAEIAYAVQTARRLAEGRAAGPSSANGAAHGRAATAVLSHRERQVLDLLARGHTRREIAGRLEIGVKSVETYRARLAQKLRLKSRADLVRYALDTGILTPR